MIFRITDDTLYVDYRRNNWILTVRYSNMLLSVQPFAQMLRHPDIDDEAILLHDRKDCSTRREDASFFIAEN